MACRAFAALSLFVFAAAPFVAACSSQTSPNARTETSPACAEGAPDCTCTGPDCSASPGSSGGTADGGADGQSLPPAENGVKDGSETDVDCGGGNAPKCTEGKTCVVDDDCDVACGYAKKCVGAPSCTTHLGGDTCGEGEVEAGAITNHESCCRTLLVEGFTDPAHPGKKVYLDKYEITAGRVRAWIDAMAKTYGLPNVKAWIETHKPTIWDDAWNDFLPADWEGPSKVINRRLLGDPRPEDHGWGVGPGVILPPPTDEPRSMGVNHQFNSTVYVDLHGQNCGVFPGAYGFPTFYYPDDILKRDGQLPRASGVGYDGKTIPAQDLLDVKSMNCITNAMLAAFCAWDGGQLATDEVLDHVTASPVTLGNISGCGTQHDDHGELLKNVFTNTVQTGGRCPAVTLVNATFDAGDNLPVPNSPLNAHVYHYPDTGNVTHDKSWQISAPGRAATTTHVANDAISLKAGSEPWMDLHGNLSEAALDMAGGTFSGKFALKFRGIGYGSSRSDLNMTQIKGETILRIQRPEAKAAYIGGRCMRFQK